MNEWSSGPTELIQNISVYIDIFIFVCKILFESVLIGLIMFVFF